MLQKKNVGYILGPHPKDKCFFFSRGGTIVPDPRTSPPLISHVHGHLEGVPQHQELGTSDQHGYSPLISHGMILQVGYFQKIGQGWRHSVKLHSNN